MNLAIVDDADEYMGTVSLKITDKNPEFAITIRKCAMGYTNYGMFEIFRIGFEELGLKRK